MSFKLSVSVVSLFFLLSFSLLPLASAAEDPLTASLTIKEWYPKGLEYVFICETNKPALYFTWYYDDGEKQIEILNQDTFHRYQAEGNYSVRCIAHTFLFESAEAELFIKARDTSTSTVPEVDLSPPLADDEGEEEQEQPPIDEEQPLAEVPQVDLIVAPNFPMDNNFVFNCEASNFVPTSYTFTFSDGHEETRPVNDIFHTFYQEGQHAVSCRASNGTDQAEDAIAVQTALNVSRFAETRIEIAAIEGYNVTTRCLPVGYTGAWFEIYASAGVYGINNGHYFPYNHGPSTMSPVHNDVTNPKFTHYLPGPGNYSFACIGMVMTRWMTPAYYEYPYGYHQSPAEGSFCRGAPYASCDSGGDAQYHLELK